MKEAIRNMLTAFYPGNDSDTLDRTSLKDPRLVRGLCESLTNAGNYRSVIMEKIRAKLGIHPPQKEIATTSERKEKTNVKV